MKNNMRIWESDAGYCKYVNAHHPEAISFIKNEVEEFQDSRNIWIDIVDYSIYPHTTPDGKWLPYTKTLFKKIIFDIFPRNIKVQYGDDVDYNRYLTWRTAVEDISQQRSQGNKGERWIVECGLDISKGPGHMEEIYVKEKVYVQNNPEYEKFLKSEEYSKYEMACIKYEYDYEEFKENRRKYFKFNLPDGSVKEVLLGLKLEERLEELRKIGVSEKEIEKVKKLFVKPTKPIPPQAPKSKIRKVIPGHYKKIRVPGEWSCELRIKSVKQILISNV